MEGRLQTPAAAIKSFGYKAPLIFISLLIPLVLWICPSSFLSYSQLSISEIQTIFGSPAVTGNVKNNFYPLTSIHDNGGVAGAPGELPTSETERLPTAEANATKPDRPVPNFNTSNSPGLKEHSPSQDEKVPVAQNSTELETFGAVKNETSTQQEASGNSTVIKEGRFTDADDSQLVDSAKVVEVPPIQKAGYTELYFMPALSFYVGTGNQLIEYKSAIVMARALNRTLCMSPFFIGPGRHFGYLGDWHSGLTMEERYSMETLSKFVKIASMPECMQACGGKLDAHWRLRKVSKAPEWNMWFNDTPWGSWDLDRNAPKWSTTKDIADFVGPRNDAKCVGLGGLFPGLRWKGVFYASSAFLEHSQGVNGAADHLLARALFGNANQPFASVHWRFEESRCRGHQKGLCFSRCGDGAVIANGRRSETWDTMAIEGKKQGTEDGFRGVFVPKEDISGAIYQKAKDFGSMNVYLATDGWIRGDESRDVVKWVVEDLRSKKVNVAGLWQIWGLPNFADGSYAVSQNIAEVFGMPPKMKVSNHIIAMVEQEVCERSTAFIGSGQSSWSLAVADTRQGRVCRRDLSKQKMAEHPGMSEAQVQDEVIDQILGIQYTPWPTCRGSKNNTNVPSEIEVNDGWLDYDACEARLLKNVGSCRRIQS